jgi:hypothetical protein
MCGRSGLRSSTARAAARIISASAVSRRTGSCPSSLRASTSSPSILATGASIPSCWMSSGDGTCPAPGAHSSSSIGPVKPPSRLARSCVTSLSTSSMGGCAESSAPRKPAPMPTKTPRRSTRSSGTWNRTWAAMASTTPPRSRRWGSSPQRLPAPTCPLTRRP